MNISLITVSCCIGLILLFSSCSNQKNSDLFDLKWEKSSKNPVIEPGFYGWDSKQVYPGTVLKIDSDYLMWYYGSDEDGPLQIGIKRSKDGIEWKKIQDSPVLTSSEKEDWDNERVSKPCVIFH